MITKNFQNQTYTITLNILSNGIISKTDIIGSLYKQLEDVLPSKINFNTLVQSNQIGVFDIKITKRNSKSYAKCLIPTSLDKKTVCLLAAKCEHITKIGHVQSTIEVIDISNKTENLEQEIEKRAEILENKFFKLEDKKNETINEIKNKKSTKIIELSKNVYSTPYIKRFKTIYLVEGRSDIKTLNDNGISNCISINGSRLDILNLFKEKWIQNKNLITLFDGDLAAKKIHKQLVESIKDKKLKIKLSKSIFAPKDREISQLNKEDINKLLNIKPKKEISQKNDNENSKNYFTKNEFFIIENYIEAIHNSNRMVGFDETFGILFDNPISKLNTINFDNVYVLIYDGLYENIINKIISKTQVKCIIARGFSEIPKNCSYITFSNFKDSITE